MNDSDLRDLIRSTVIDMFREGTLSLDYEEDLPDYFSSSQEHTISLTLNDSSSDSEILSEITFSVSKPQD